MNKIFNSDTKVQYIILFIITVLSIYPFFYMISTSLMTGGEAANQYLFPKKLMFENYFRVWTSNNFQSYTLNSLIIASIVVSGILFTSIPAAYAFARIEFPFKNIIFYFLIVSLMIPEIIMLLPHLLIIRGDIFPLPFGSSWMNSLKGLTIPFMGNIFVIFLLRQYFKKIPTELWDAARMDGATAIKAFFFITLPLIKFPLFISAILGTIFAINSFDLFFVLTKGGPGNITTNATLFVWNNAFKFYHLSYASAISYVILMFSMLVTIGYVVIMRKIQVD